MLAMKRFAFGYFFVFWKSHRLWINLLLAGCTNLKYCLHLQSLFLVVSMSLPPHNHIPTLWKKRLPQVVFSQTQILKQRLRSPSWASLDELGRVNHLNLLSSVNSVLLHNAALPVSPNGAYCSTWRKDEGWIMLSVQIKRPRVAAKLLP